ncbi:MAG: cytochrome C [Rhodobacteraceae bacterium]|nr:cytochrome C [Paracoccaceae bacterium]
MPTRRPARAAAAALAAGLAAAAALPAAAAGDPAAGETVFKQCQTCHVVQAPDGTFLAGKAGKTGPNLYGVVGRAAASYPDFRYGDGITAAAAAGLVWDEEKIATYVQDPTAFLDSFTGDPKLKSKMSFKLRKPEDAANVAAFLAQWPAEAQTQ